MFKSCAHVLITLCFAFVSFEAGAQDCPGIFATLFRAKSKIEVFSDYQYLQKIDRLERFNNRLRNFRDPSVPAQSIKTNKKLVKLDSYILTGDVHTPERDLAPLFRKVEMSYLVAQNNQKLIDHLSSVQMLVDWGQIKKLGFTDQQVSLWRESLGEGADSVFVVRELEKQRNNSLVELGLNYHDYRIFREHLDELSEEKSCTPECLAAIKHLLSDIGISSEKEQLRFPRILGGATRPTLADIRSTVHSSKLATLVRLRKERNAEIILAFKTLLKKSTLFDVISKRLATLPGLYETRLIRLFKSFYDQRARELFFPEMNRLLRADLKDLEDMLTRLKAINAKFDSDEFLVNLSRRIDGLARDFWFSLKEEASQRDPGFLDRMLKAEKRGSQKGGLSLIPEPSLLNKFTLVLLAGGVVTYYTLSPEVTVTPLDSSQSDEVLPVSVFDENAEKMFEEIGDMLEQNEELFSPESEEDFGALRHVEALRLPASQSELESPPGLFTRWFKNLHWKIRGTFLWR